jgi:hypothetical protein
MWSMTHKHSTASSQSLGTADRRWPIMSKDTCMRIATQLLIGCNPLKSQKIIRWDRKNIRHHYYPTMFVRALELLKMKGTKY